MPDATLSSLPAPAIFLIAACLPDASLAALSLALLSSADELSLDAAAARPGGRGVEVPRVPDADPRPGGRAAAGRRSHAWSHGPRRGERGAWRGVRRGRARRRRHRTRRTENGNLASDAADQVPETATRHAQQTQPPRTYEPLT